MQAANAADTAIEVCLLMRRADVVWEEVYPRYLACGQHPALLDRLLPHMLASKLPSFPPEVMQVSSLTAYHTPAPSLMYKRRNKLCSSA